jgi:tRNA threonylcarbamoyladenosine biosynthesis protein TsaB
LNLVVIDTSTRFAGVGLVNNADDRATRAWRSNRNHGRELMPAIIESLADVSLSATEITHVAVALGPGGFSAVRVGISAALGLVVARQLPVLGISTHEIEAEPYVTDAGPDTPLYSLIPAGRNEISWTRHIAGSKSESTKGIASPEQLIEQLEPDALLCGEACDLMAGLVEASRFRGHAAPTRNPNSIIDMAIRKFESGVSTPYEELRPIYARPPSITKPKPPK